MNKFSIKEAVNFGFGVAKKNILFYLGIFTITILISGVSSGLQRGLKEAAFFAFLFSLITWVISEIVGMGILRINLKFVDGTKPRFADLFVFDWRAIFNYILAAIMSGIIIGVGFILLIIPGIIFAIKLQYVGYLVVDKKLRPVEAIKKSWAMTKGNVRHLFVLGLALLGINILGLLVLIVGLLVTVPLSMVTTAFVFRKLSA
jgi:uncharacterized membrane protein